MTTGRAKVVLLTGAPATGKSTLAGYVQGHVQPVRSIDYGELLLCHLRRSSNLPVSYRRMRTLSAAVISHRDVEKLDNRLISEIRRLRRNCNIIIDSHAVTRERFGFRVTPFSLDQLGRLDLDAVGALHCDPRILAARIKAHPEGRRKVTSEQARHHQFLQQAVAITYAIACGCPLFVLDNTGQTLSEAAGDFIDLLRRIGAKLHPPTS